MTTAQRIAQLAGLACFTVAIAFAVLTITTDDGGVGYMFGCIVFLACAVLLIALSRPSYRDEFWSR